MAEGTRLRLAGMRTAIHVDHAVRVRAAGLEQIDPMCARYVQQLDAICSAERTCGRGRLAARVGLVGQKPRVTRVKERLCPWLNGHVFEIDQTGPRAAGDLLVILWDGGERLGAVPETAGAWDCAQIDCAVRPTRRRRREACRHPASTLCARSCSAQHRQRAEEETLHVHRSAYSARHSRSTTCAPPSHAATMYKAVGKSGCEPPQPTPS